MNTVFMIPSSVGGTLSIFESEIACATRDVRALIAAALTARLGLFEYSWIPSLSPFFTKTALRRWK